MACATHTISCGINAGAAASGTKRAHFAGRAPSHCGRSRDGSVAPAWWLAAAAGGRSLVAAAAGGRFLRRRCVAAASPVLHLASPLLVAASPA